MSLIQRLSTKTAQMDSQEEDARMAAQIRHPFALLLFVLALKYCRSALVGSSVLQSCVVIKRRRSPKMDHTGNSLKGNTLCGSVIMLHSGSLFIKPTTDAENTSSCFMRFEENDDIRTERRLGYFPLCERSISISKSLEQYYIPLVIKDFIYYIDKKPE